MSLEGRMKELSMMKFVSLEYLEEKGTEAIVKTNAGYLLTTFLAVDGIVLGFGYLTKNIVGYLTN